MPDGTNVHCSPWHDTFMYTHSVAADRAEHDGQASADFYDVMSRIAEARHDVRHGETGSRPTTIGLSVEHRSMLPHLGALCAPLPSARQSTATDASGWF